MYVNMYAHARVSQEIESTDPVAGPISEDNEAKALSMCVYMYAHAHVSQEIESTDPVAGPISEDNEAKALSIFKALVALRTEEITESRSAALTAAENGRETLVRKEVAQMVKDPCVAVYVAVCVSVCVCVCVCVCRNQHCRES